MYAGYMYSGYLLALCSLSFLAWLTYVQKRDVLYPAFIYCSIWAAVLAVFGLQLAESYRLSDYTLAIFVVSALAFSAGAMLSRHFAGIRCNVNFATWKRPLVPHSTGRIILFGYCLVMFPFFVLDVRRLAQEGGMDNFILSARAAMMQYNFEEKNFHSSAIIATAPLIAALTAFIFLIEEINDRKTSKLFWGVFVIALLDAILTTGRTEMMQLFTGVFCIYFFKKYRDRRLVPNLPRLLLCGFLILGIIGGGLMFLDKSVADIEDFGGGGYMFVLYIVSPLSAYDFVVQHPESYTHEAHHTFRYFLRQLSRLGLEYRQPPSLDEPVFVPFPANVYTAYKFYYTDFGLTGVICFMLIVGFMHGLLYEKAMQGSDAALFFFAVSLYPLVMSTFDDEYSMVDRWLRALLVGIVYFGILRKLPRLLPLRSRPVPVSTQA